MFRPIEFMSEGAILRGRLYLPPSPEKKPLVIMAHGTSATITMVTDRYAEAFCNSGMAVLLYDHRNFGISDGEPRQEINPWTQCRGYRDAIAFATTLPQVDSERIGLWGDSFTGGEVVVVGAIDDRVKVVVAQCPTFGAERPALQPNTANFLTLKETFAHGDVRGSADTTTGPLPVVSFDPIGAPSLLLPIQAFRWFIDYGGRAGTRWMNRVTRVIPRTPVPYSPFLCAPFLKQPALMMVAPDDEMAHANYQVAKDAFSLMPGHKEWYDIEGGHFGLLYYPSELFEQASRVQSEFFLKWLV